VFSDANHGIGKYVCSRYGCGKVSEIDTEMGGMCAPHSHPLLFEIQRPYALRDTGDRVPRYVPWEFVRPHNKQALRNHGGQTLARLSERGGLSLLETLAVVTGRDWSAYEHMKRDEAATMLLRLLDEWEAKTSWNQVLDPPIDKK
jgi:hypothetical protein